MQQWLECNRESLEPQFVVRKGLKLGAHQCNIQYTREAPEGQVSHSPMGMVGSVVPAKPCADKSSS